MDNTHKDYRNQGLQRIFILVYSLSKSERLSANIELTLHKALL